MVFTSCATKIKFDHYSLPCDTEGIEVGDLYLFSNGKFFLQTRYCDGNLQFPAESYGTFAWQPDSAVTLTSQDNKLDLIDVTESKTTDSTYIICLLDKSSSGVFNETIKIILNQTDTTSWLSQFRV
ncbi:MAG: copper resistance protein NlpE N-terminal domain-containing protein, partial [Bacteroidia bacterium]